MSDCRHAEYRYEVDRVDCIRNVNTAFLDFAFENGAADLSSGDVLGKPLWDFVSGAAVRHLYDLMFTQVRTTGKTIAVPFRCDSPDRRRFMELTIAPASDEGLSLVGGLLRQEERAEAPLLDVKAVRSELLLRMCSWCKKVESPVGEWVEVEDAVRSFHLFEASTLPGVTHGICPPCAERARRAIGAE